MPRSAEIEESARGKPIPVARHQSGLNGTVTKRKQFLSARARKAASERTWQNILPCAFRPPSDINM